VEERVPLWYTPALHGTPLHTDLPVKTSVIIPVFSFETQQEFFVIFFAFDEMEVSRVIFQFE